jgi:hypothetical protein
MKKYPFDKVGTSVQTAEDWTMNAAHDGAECPCCGQYVKVYRRKLYSAMAYALLLIHRSTENKSDPWVHVPKLLNGHGTVARGGDFAKLVHWDLLESHEKDSGFYKLTEKGIQFAECRIAVPIAVYIYNGARLDWDSSEMITVVEALNDKFNYEKLMST